MQKDRSSFLIICAATILFFVVGLYLAKSEEFPSLKHVRVLQFQRVYSHKERVAIRKLESMERLALDGKADSINHLAYSKSDDIAYYLFNNRDTSLIFWSDNAYDIAAVNYDDLQDDSFVELPNAVGVVKKRVADDYTLVAFLKIKNCYEKENEYLQNDFANGFHIDKSQNVMVIENEDSHPIYSASGACLFFLTDGLGKESSLAYYLSVLFYAMGMVMLFHVYVSLHMLFGDGVYKLRNFLIILSVFVVLICVCLVLHFPSEIFSLTIFSSFYEVSDGFMNSVGHLAIITTLMMVSCMLYYFKVDVKIETTVRWRQWLYMVMSQLFSVLFFGVVCWMFTYLLQNAKFSIAFMKLQDISWLSLFTYVLIAVWFTSYMLFRNKTMGVFLSVFKPYSLFIVESVIALLFVVFGFFVNYDVMYVSLWYLGLCIIMNITRAHNMKYLSYPALMLVVGVFAVFVVWYSYKYESKIHRENLISIVEKVIANKKNNADYAYLVGKDSLLRKDKNIQRYMVSGVKSNTKLSSYIASCYFGGKNYEIKAYVIPKSVGSANYKFYSSACEKGKNISNTNFYDTYVRSIPFDYLGMYTYPQYEGDTLLLCIEVYRQSKMDYSYANILSHGESELPRNMSICEYFNENLESSYGRVDYPVSSDWIKGKKYMRNGGYNHYIYHQRDRIFVVSEQGESPWLSFVIYLVYLLTFYIFFGLAVYAIWRRVNHIREHSTSFNKLLQSLMSFFVLGVTILFVVVVILNVYQTRRTSDKESTLIATSVQELFEKLFVEETVLKESTINSQVTLSELANVLSTEVHLYGLSGELIVTSRPKLFSEGYLSGMMNPMIYFSSMRNSLTKVKESVGDLYYNASYFPIRNGRNVVIGYVSIPMFEQRIDVRNTLFRSLAIIVFVYLLLICISLLVCYRMANQITRPIQSIENSLKNLRIGGGNEKIVYSGEMIDEVSHLIELYNVMVDELTKNVEKLAQSERSQAWKEMAQQVAHDIKNPLTPMKLSIQQLQRLKMEKDERFNDIFDKKTPMLIEQIETLTQMVNDFSELARVKSILVEVDIVRLLQQQVELFKNSNESLQVNLVSSNKSIIVMGDKSQLVRVFVNLMQNALQSIPVDKEGRIDIRASIVDGKVNVEVSDNGIGMADEVKMHLFTPHFTTKMNGNGLGLSIVKSLVESMGGEITYTSKIGCGTTFILQFPISSIPE